MDTQSYERMNMQEKKYERTRKKVENIKKSTTC